MAARDIMPWVSPHGGHELVKALPIAASQSFNIGEPVILTTGQVNGTTGNPATIEGIAAEPATDNDSVALAVNTPVGIYRITDTSYFVAENYSEDGTGATAVTPVAADIGNSVGLVLNGSDWFADNAVGNQQFRIVAVLDADNLDITNPNLSTGTGDKVVLEVI